MQGGIFTAYKTGTSIHHHSVVFGPSNEVILHEEVTSASESDTNGSRQVRYTIQPMRPLSEPFSPASPLGQDIVRMSSDNEADAIRIERAATKKKMGKRRHRRLLNDFFMGEHTGRPLPQSMEEAKKEWYDLYLPHRESIFERLMNDPEAFSRFQPFLNIDMDHQEELLHQLCGAKGMLFKEPNPEDSGPARFRLLNYDGQGYLRRVMFDQASSIGRFQEAFAGLIASGSVWEKLEFELSRSERYLCHCVAQYYRLKSNSWEEQRSGSSVRVTFVWCPTEAMPNLPTTSLKDHLHSLPKRGWTEKEESRWWSANNRRVTTSTTRQTGAQRN